MIQPKRKKGKHKEAPWKLRIKKQIDEYRKELSRLDEHIKSNNVKKSKLKFLKKYFKKLNTDNILEVKEVIKQKMQAKSQRLRRYEKRCRSYRQNQLFTNNPKIFYRSLLQKSMDTKKIPSMEALQEFWGNIWSVPKVHNAGAEWIQREADSVKPETQQWDEVTAVEVNEVLTRSQKWKSPGCDKVPNYWLYHLPAVHKLLAKLVSELIETPESAPKWLTLGMTYLIPKTEDTTNPKNYRPITCLSTMYKLLTSVLTERTYSHLNKWDLMPNQQKGCRRGSYGCKDQLLINKTVMEECRVKHKNLSMAWVDYRKAFDSVPHSWILQCMSIYGLSPKVIKFTELTMKNWKTILYISHNEGQEKSDETPIRCGIYQGDSFSPLLFCMALFPLSRILDDVKGGYTINKTTLTHLFYMDDLKLYAKTEEALKDMLTATNLFSTDIGMSFGIEKCAKVTLKKGKQIQAGNVTLDQDLVVQDLEQERSYKYLGIEEAGTISHKQMKERIRKEFYRRVRKVLQSDLNSKNKMTALNTLAIPVVTYSFNIIDWSMQEMKRMDIKVRKLLTINRMHHPKADVDRIYLPRAEGGRGMIQLENAFKTSTIGLEVYLKDTKETLLKCVYLQDKMKKLNSITHQSEKFKNEINYDPTPETNLPNVTKAKKAKGEAKKLQKEKLKEKWEKKALHGQFVKRLNAPNVSTRLSTQWLNRAGLKGETEGLILAAQDQSLATNNYKKMITKTKSDDMCRVCKSKPETIDHIVAGCSLLAPTEYLKRHNEIGKYLHWSICRSKDIKVTEKWYNHEPKTVTENDRCTILWDLSINTDRRIPANRPDIVIKDQMEKKCYLIDMSVPGDSNVIAKEYEKRSKYKDLEIEIQRMWKMKAVVVPVVVGALGIMSKDFEKYLKELPSDVSSKQIQKIALLGTAHILRKILSLE